MSWLLGPRSTDEPSHRLARHQNGHRPRPDTRPRREFLFYFISFSCCGFIATPASCADVHRPGECRGGRRHRFPGLPFRVRRAPSMRQRENRVAARLSAGRGGEESGPGEDRGSQQPLSLSLSAGVRLRDRRRKRGARANPRRSRAPAQGLPAVVGPKNTRASHLPSLSFRLSFPVSFSRDFLSLFAVARRNVFFTSLAVLRHRLGPRRSLCVLI